jgi:hypothetical protein
MKKITKTKKLGITHETVRKLMTQDLGKAVGGTGATDVCSVAPWVCFSRAHCGPVLQ